MREGEEREEGRVCEGEEREGRGECVRGRGECVCVRGELSVATDKDGAGCPGGRHMHGAALPHQHGSRCSPTSHLEAGRFTLSIPGRGTAAAVRWPRAAHPVAAQRGGTAPPV